MGMASSPKYKGYQLEVNLESQIVKDEMYYIIEIDNTFSKTS